MKALRLMVFCLEGIYLTSVLYKQHLYSSYVITENFWPEVSVLSSLSHSWTKRVRYWNRIPWVAINWNCITFYFDDTLYYFSCLFTFLVERLPLEDWIIWWKARNMNWARRLFRVRKNKQEIAFFYELQTINYCRY